MSASTTRRTIDHAVIRRWAEQRGAQPALVKGDSLGTEVSGLRLGLPNFKGIWLSPISWDEFFLRFEERELEFLYQDVTREGDPSDFFKLINRSRALSRGENMADGERESDREQAKAA